MARERLLSLDVMRGLTVIGMVLVNSAAVFHYGSGGEVWGPLLHAPWAGITIADLVFPFFIFMVGVSIPFALSGLKAREGLTRETALRIIKRGLILFLIGLGLTVSLVGFDGPVRLLGVLQRIGLTFVIASLLFMTLGWRALAATAFIILVAHDPVAILPIPDADVDYLAPGQNFSHWLDRTILGGSIYAPHNPLPFEPEGLLGTLPSAAQALIGVLTGMWLKARAGEQGLLKPLWGAAFGMVAFGLMWALMFPPVKALWSASFVWITSGLGLALLNALYWWLDIKKAAIPGARFAQAFGINAITGYVVHTYLMSPMLNTGPNLTLYETLAAFIPAPLAAMPGIIAVITASWIPVAVMQRNGWILKV
jgi:predicted acyltransferase